MKILYIVSRPLEINTSASIRNIATIKGFIENGHEVDIVTTEPDINHLAYDSSMKINNVRTFYLKLGGIQSIARIGRSICFLEPIKKKVVAYMNKRNIYDNLVDIVHHIDVIGTNIKKYDYIISSSDPKSSHLFVYKLLEKYSYLFGGKWIQIWGDPFADDITVKNTVIALNKKKREEAKLLMAADKIVYVSKLTLERQMILYPLVANKMEYCPIPFIEQQNYKLRNLKKNLDIKLAYCGDYDTKIRNILPLYNYVNKTENLHLTICGMSNLRLKSTNKVTVLPRIERNQVKEIEKEADILVHLSNLSGYQIPGKIYQYSGTNKPILFILDGNCDKIVEIFRVYNRYYFSRNDEENLKKTILKIKDNADVSVINKPVDEFSPSHISKKILGVE